MSIMAPGQPHVSPARLVTAPVHSRHCPCPPTNNYLLAVYPALFIILLMSRHRKIKGVNWFGAFSRNWLSVFFSWFLSGQNSLALSCFDKDDVLKEEEKEKQICLSQVSFHSFFFFTLSLSLPFLRSNNSQSV